MLSWLNFEELLIHNPVDLINPNNSVISVAMNKKQYIDFFSNKYAYNGLYYDEEMDFCIFYYADPLQSSKNGDIYAQGYIDVDMKIYRVKWLCNVSISGLGALNGISPHNHTAWSYSADGTDRFSTAYPNFNLLDGTKYFSGTWTNSDSWTTDGTYKGLTVKKRTGQWNGIYKTFTAPKDGTYTFSAYVKSSGNSAYVIRFGGVNSTSSQGALQKDLGNNFDWIRDSVTVNLKANDTAWIKYEISSTSADSIVWTAGHKWEQDSVNTSYMPNESETTTVDRPSYIGQYTDNTQENSTNPATYTWSKIQVSKWNVKKTEIVVNSKTKTITTVLNGALSKCTVNKDITGWNNQKPNNNYNYRQPQYSLDIGGNDFIISGYGLRGLKNG